MIQTFKGIICGIQNANFGLTDDSKIPLFCATIIDEEILTKNKKNARSICEDVKKELSNFGEYCLLINHNSFTERLIKSCKNESLGYSFGKVEYVNESMNSIAFNNLINSDVKMETLFRKKHISYKWQNEWRIVLHKIFNEKDYEELSIGKFEVTYINYLIF